MITSLIVASVSIVAAPQKRESTADCAIFSNTCASGGSPVGINKRYEKRYEKLHAAACDAYTGPIASSAELVYVTCLKGICTIRDGAEAPPVGKK